MAREFLLPDIGEGLTEAEIVRWLVAEGDEVQADQPIVEVETDKAVVEIPSPYAGVVLSHGGAEGEVIAVGSVLVTIGEPGDAAAPTTPEPEQPPRPPEPEPQPDPLVRAEPEPIVGTLDEEPEVLLSRAETTPEIPAAVQALPVVRKLARDSGVELADITGTGPGGRITRQDVEAAIGAPEPPPPATVEDTTSHAVGHEFVGAGHGIADEDQEVPEPVQPAEPAVPAEAAVPAGDERQQMSRLRRTISANMSKSWAEIPHVTTFEEVDATRLLEVRRALGERHGLKIPIEALVIKALLPAIDRYPEFNSSIDGDDLVMHASRDIGIAVDTPDGLLVAVVEDASSKSVMDLSAEIRRLGEGAKARTLQPSELTGQTFTVSNIGAVGGGHGTPIVPYGTVAILSVGAAKLRPVVFDDDLAIAPVMPLSLSYDHRVIDGAVGRRFTALLIENLEEPALFLAG